MSKQIYIDENGNELLVSGTINTGDMLPITSGSVTNTKDYIDSSNKYKVGDTIDLSGCYFAGQVSNSKYRFIFTVTLPKDASGLNLAIENFSIALVGGGNYLTPAGTNTITINGSGNKIGINATAYFSEQWGALTLDDIYLIRFISGTLRFTT